VSVVAVGVLIVALAWPPIQAGFADGAATKGAAATETIFDPDPAHPWNRLHAVFFIRDMGNGQTYNHQGPDAPFGSWGPFLVKGPSHDRAIAALDDFLRAKDDARIDDPIRRALLQRDLWSVFDRLSDKDGDQPQRRAVQKRLAWAMRRLEQPAARLLALPDSYAATVKNGAFAKEYDPRHPSQPYLPADLRLDGKGDWVQISPATARGYWYSAPRHTEFTNGRSVFATLLRLPGGRKPTEDYIARMPRATDSRVDFDRLPDGSQVVLVRRMLLVDDMGELQTTPVTESIQLRIFIDGREQRFFEFTLDRAGLASGGGGLRAVGPDDRQYFIFGMHENDDDPSGFAKFPGPVRVLSNCVGCHHGESLFTINTLNAGSKSQYRGAAETEFAAQLGESMTIRKQSYAWGLLQGLRESTPP